jgi:hypothetical protein
MEIALLVLGSLFGLLTGPIAENIRRRRARGDLARVIQAEVTELRFQAAAISHKVQAKHGTLTRANLTWTSQHLSGSHLAESKGLVEVLEKLAQRSDPELTAAAQYIETKDQDRHISFREFQMPFLNVQLHQLDVFSAHVQENLLGLTMQIRHYNEIIAEAKAYAALTFNDGLSSDNRGRIVGNLRQAESLAGDIAHDIADRIESLGPIR